GLAARWVVGDAVSGSDPVLRAGVETLAPACHYLLAVAASSPAWAAAAEAARLDRRGRTRVRWQGGTTAAVAAALPASAWQRLAVARGAKGPRIYDWAA